MLGRLGQDWPRMLRRSAGVRSYPHRMNSDEMHNLMYQGYVSVWANLTTLWDEAALGGKLPDPVAMHEFKTRFQCNLP